MPIRPDDLDFLSFSGTIEEILAEIDARIEAEAEADEAAVMKAEEKDKKETTQAAEEKEKDTLFGSTVIYGKAKYDAVDVKSSLMEFKISTPEEDIPVCIDRKGKKTGNEVLIPGRTYEFRLTEDESGKTMVDKFVKAAGTSGKCYTQHEVERLCNISPDLPEYFAGSLGQPYRGVKVGVFLKGPLTNISLQVNGFFANIKYKRKTYSVVCDITKKVPDNTRKALKYIEDYALDNDLIEKHFDMNKNNPVAIFGVLIGSTVYIETLKVLNVNSKYEAEGWPEDVCNAFERATENISSKKREAILEYVKNRSVYPEASTVHKGDRNEFSTTSELKLKYLACKRFLPEYIQLAVEKTLEDGSLKEQHRRMILEVLLNTNWDAKLDLCTDRKALRRGMDETHYGMDTLKNKLIRIAEANEKKTGAKGIRILLVGGAGVGKTSLVKRFSEVYGIPFAKIPLNGVDTPLFLKGTPRLYDNAILGRVVRAVSEVGNRSLILLDEVDKMATENRRDGNPYSALYDLLDPNELFCDEMMESGIDLSDTMFVLTANNIKDVPASILSRVEIFFVPGYTKSDKIHIAREYVIPKYMKEFGLDESQVIIDKKVPSLVADRYTVTDGVREIESNVRSIMESAVSLIKQSGTSVKVTPKVLETMLCIDTKGADDIQHGFAELKNKFKVFKPLYSSAILKAAGDMFDAYEVADKHEKEDLRKRLFYLVNPVPGKGAEGQFDLEEIRRKLDETHIGMEKAKNELLTLLGERNLSQNNKVKCILLQGMCGIGKTSIARAFASSMNIPFVKISLNGVSNPEHIKGYDKSFNGAEPGVVVRKLAETGTTASLVLLDEIDKMVRIDLKDPYTALLDLLDNTGGFYDNYVGAPVDLSETVFVATSNYIENIPTAVLDRMTVISLEGYTADEKYRITKENIIPVRLSDFGLSDKVVFTAGAVKCIVYDYCKSYGMRDVERAVDKIVGRIIMDRNCIVGDNTVIDVAFVTKVLGAKPIERGNFSKVQRPGTARALAVSGNSGTTFAIEVTENPYGNGDEITGLPKQSTLDSIKIAKLLVSKRLKKALPGLHIHFSEGGIEKDGPSAGVTVYAAILSEMLNIPISGEIGFTGEINVFGDVWAIGGTELKIIAAQNAGCKKVFVPYDNYIQLEEDSKLEEFTCEVIPVSTVDELCDMLFGEESKNFAV